MTHVADTLRKAAEMIEVQGLAQGSWYDGEGRVCTLEAIYRAATGNTDAGSAHLAASRGEITLAEHNRYRYACITLRNWLRTHGVYEGPIKWSDRHTGAQVIETLRACADDEDRRNP